MFSFAPARPVQNERELRAQVRAFLAERLADTAPETLARSWLKADPEFSAALAARGWIGMIWPCRYGGGERDPLERYVVLEELLFKGAPVGAHWVADRQTGPLLLRYGNEAQRERFLRPMAQGKLFFCIGMSEPNSGSDLSSVATKAERVDGGWRVSGTKLWTSNAQIAHYMVALVRTDLDAKRQHGLSQLIIDLSDSGVSVRPIIDLTGDSHFNEVHLDQVFVPDIMLVGTEGEGWTQVTAELSLERSGPERFLSSIQILEELVRTAQVGSQNDDLVVCAIGKAAAELWALRQMSMSVAAALREGRDPAIEAAIVKDLGNSFEQALPTIVQALVDADVFSCDSRLRSTLYYLLQAAPSFSLRGGTREVLRGIIARGLDLR